MQISATPSLAFRDTKAPSFEQSRGASGSSSAGLFINPVVSILATGLVAVLVKSLSTPNSWAYQFFFCRRFVQWIIVWMCIHGLVELARRIPVWLRERRGLRAWLSGGAPSADAGLVRERYQHLQQLLECAPVVDLRAGSRRLAEEAAAQLDARYSTVNVLTHLASYCGFFGTVLGLSVGLYQAFGGQGALSLQSFGKAVSTSFDTTLSGVACTILLIMMQSLVRSREDTVLAATDQLVEDTLLRHEQEVASNLNLNGLPVSSQNHAELFNRTVDAIAAQIREVAMASCSVIQHTQSLVESAAQTNAELRSASAKMDSITRTQEELCREAVAASHSAAQQTQAVMEAVTQSRAALGAASGKMDDLQRAVEEARSDAGRHLTQLLSTASEQSSRAAEVVQRTNQVAEGVAELKNLVSRPRVLQITEAV